MFKFKLSGFWFVFAILFLALWITLFVSVALTGQISPYLFIAGWCLGTVLIISALIKLWLPLYKKCFPYPKKEIEQVHGKIKESFSVCLARIANVPLRNFYARVNLYPDFVAVDFYGRCLVVKDFSKMEFSDGIFGAKVEIWVDETTSITLYPSKKLTGILYEFVNKLKERTNV